MPKPIRDVLSPPSSPADSSASMRKSTAAPSPSPAPGPKHVPERKLRETATELRRDIAAAQREPDSVLAEVKVMVQRTDKNSLQMTVTTPADWHPKLASGDRPRFGGFAMAEAKLLSLASAYADGLPPSTGPDDPNPGFRATVAFAPALEKGAKP